MAIVATVGFIVLVWGVYFLITAITGMPVGSSFQFLLGYFLPSISVVMLGLGIIIFAQKIKSKD
jgi:hypothetical protein